MNAACLFSSPTSSHRIYKTPERLGRVIGVHAQASNRPGWRKELANIGKTDAKELVYLATFPLVGLEALEGGITFLGYEMPDVLAQHCAVLVESQEDKVKIFGMQLRP